MRRAFASLAALAIGAMAAPAPAQIVPGTRPPADAAEAIDDAQSLVCFLAAAGRPMPGLNMPLIGGEGMTPLDAVPEALAPFVHSAPDQRIVLVTAPGEPVWIVHDARSGRCSIYSFTAAAPVEAKLLASLGRGRWKRQADAGEGIDHAFALKIGPERFRTEISIPDSSDRPLVVVVRPGKR